MKPRLLALIVGAVVVANGAIASGLLTVGTNINITRLTNNQTETTIAVNPQNPQQLFAAVNGGFNYGSGHAGLPSVFYYSTNGGTIWSASDVSALPVSCCDQSSSWDDFGNLFLIYLAQTGPAVLALSTNGGASFSLVYESTGVPDQPTVITGPGGAYASGSVWITYSSSSGLVANGAPVYGFGSVGAFGGDELIPGGGTFGDIAVGPNGQVLVTYQSGSGSPDTIGVNLDPDGLGPAGFDAQVVATTTLVPGFLAIPAQPHRTIDAEAGLAWDRSNGSHRGRVYLVYTDRPNSTGYDTDIYLRYSDDNGSTWTSPLRVNDDAPGNGKSQFLPRIALDPTTGYIAVSFHDSRNSSANTTAEYWATASLDGGVSCLPNVKVSAGMSSANVVAVSSYKFDFGDYSGLAFYGGIIYPCWGDNSNSTGNNPEGTLTTLDAYMAAVIVAPPLRLTQIRTNLLVTWPHPSTGFVLQEASSLISMNWSNSSTAVQIVNGQKQVTFNLSNSPHYFRLRRP